MTAPVYWVYILECENDSLYTGYTTNLLRRFEEHKRGIRCRYTRSFKPRAIAGAWYTEDRGQALSMERFLKSLGKAQKLAFITAPERLVEHFAHRGPVLIWEERDRQEVENGTQGMAGE
ncbi:nuclease [Legionella geestiana]|uniref:Nuclease n=1 Tax=Legionella geestiana TaxID=45065 RepID=A0A0W0U3K7_9GAMM|nr:GIY-YIG nuclease family protein [Legionella geestiana]KTD02330.1 nuclease [Legionella geestiana]QBS12194.1 GIY-YIG nuclease family protein [Legionella geestiana]STX53076.1 nuclease [Legionella geestiana]